MYEHLDDSSGFVADAEFRQAVGRRATSMRLRRRRAAGGLCAAIVIGGGASVAALDAASGPRRATIEIDASSGSGPSNSSFTPTSIAYGTTVLMPTTQPIVAIAPLDSPTNILLTASDSRDCINLDSPYSGAFGPVGGERADTIILIHLDPAAQQVSVLSFPRDLWVAIPDRGNSRINAALDLANPQMLIDTISQNFYLGVDHYINVDFCGFMAITRALGGVDVPFEFAVRDKNTGLNIEAPGCRSLEGDEALAYVRSRKFEYLDPADGRWKIDGTSDVGRMARQRDFLVRAFAEGAADPASRIELAEAFLEYATTDASLTFDRIASIIATFDTLDPSTIATLQFPADLMMVGDASVLRPNMDKAADILRIFSGQSESTTTGASIPGLTEEEVLAAAISLPEPVVASAPNC
jgi:LCP family protein required for cell wall assembly